MKKKVAVIGGGLAGLATAIRLAEAGWSPIVVETRKKLGGRATSFEDPRSGRTLDNCQHVVMGCCSNLVDFYDRLGVLDQIEWHEETWWANPPGNPDRLSPSFLPAPLHFTGGFMRMRLLSVKSKHAISRAMFSLLRLGLAGRMGWRDRTFQDFLREQNQPAEAIELFWTPIIVSACNLGVEEVAANLAMKVIQEGFLAGRWHSAIGLARADLSALYDPAAEIIEGAGGRIMAGASAHGIAYDGVRVSGVITNQGMVHAASVVSALPPERLARIASLPMRDADSRLRRLDEFETSPILGVHLFFDAPIMNVGDRAMPYLVLPGRPTQWLFNKGEGADGLHHVHAVISAAVDWMGLTEHEIAERVLQDIYWALPAARGLVPSVVRAIKEKRATFKATPAINRLRPSVQAGVGAGGVGITNLFLTGDWCDTGWPATMEGAVRSGYQAAAAITGTGGVVPDVPVARMPRWLGLR